MIKRTFIVERGMYDQHHDRVIISGMSLPESGTLVITQDFKPNLPPVGVAKVYIEDGVLKADAEMNEMFVQAYPSIGFRPIEAVDNELGGVDMKQCELLALAVSFYPNMDSEIKRICDQRQVLVCSRLATDCLKKCEHPDDKTLCPNVKVKCYG